MRGYFKWLTEQDWASLGFTGVAFALESGEELGRIHVQGYAEHKQMRYTTLGKKFKASAAAFSVVRSSTDSYNYCTGRGVHAEKPALARFEWGEFKLHGDTQKADLKMMVDLVLQGATPMQLIQHYPYAWTVHRDRLIKLMRDLEQIERRGRLDITRPPRY